MKTYSRQPETKADTAQPKASRQASAHDVLQAYKNKIVQRQEIDEDELLQGKFGDAVQREEFDEDELLQGKFDTAQREGIDEDKLLQGKFDASSTTQREEATQQPPTENRTGMLDNLKSGIEFLSGYSMDDVRVHYNSSKPAQLQALAYAQGSDIHIAPGQEQHLPHEAWHVVQQKQGRVQPTTQLQGVNVNDNEGLEKEADVMGEKAVQRKNRIEIYKLSENIQNIVQKCGRAPTTKERTKRAIVVNRHAIPHPALDLGTWYKTLMTTRIADLYRTPGGFPGHALQIDQELARLINAIDGESIDGVGYMQGQSLMTAFEYMEKIRGFIKSKAKEIQFDIPKYIFSFYGASTLSIERRDGILYINGRPN